MRAYSIYILYAKKRHSLSGGAAAAAAAYVHLFAFLSVD